MTNTVFIEHKKVPKANAKAMKKELQAYAISVALKFPTETISDQQKIKVAKSSVRELLKRFDFPTKNMGTLINDEVVGNLQQLYFAIKRRTDEPKKELLEMIRIVRLLRKTHPKKYKKLFNSLEEQLSKRQQTIFNIYLKFPHKKKKTLMYKTVSKLSRIPVGTIKGQMKFVVKTMNRLMRQQKIHGR